MVRSTLYGRSLALFAAFTLGAWAPVHAQQYVNARTHARLELAQESYSLGATTGRVSGTAQTQCLWAQTGPPTCGARGEQTEWWGETWYRQRPLAGRYVRTDALELVLQPDGKLLVPVLRVDGVWWTERDRLCVDLPTTGQMCNSLGELVGTRLTWGQWEFTRQ